METTNKLLLPLNLQYFAEETPPADDTQTNQDGQLPADTKVDASDAPTKTFTQDELNDQIAKRLERERKKFEKYADYDDLKAKAAAYEAELEAKRQAELTETERAQELAKKFEEEKQALAAQLEAVRKQAEQERIRNAFNKLAIAADIEYVDDALALADLSQVTVNEDGTIEGVDAVVTQLVESKPFLLRKKTPQAIGQAMNVSGNAAPDKSVEQILAEAAAKAKASGRIEDRIAYDKLKREFGK